jgi:hypothetical protein
VLRAFILYVCLSVRQHRCVEKGMMMLSHGVGYQGIGEREGRGASKTQARWVAYHHS